MDEQLTLSLSPVHGVIRVFWNRFRTNTGSTLRPSALTFASEVALSLSQEQPPPADGPGAARGQGAV